jgi:hypothetical protein
MLISGCVGFKNNNERKMRYKELKREFKGNVTIIVQNKLLIYSTIVDRNFI